jgi:hypothetical protein
LPVTNTRRARIIPNDPIFLITSSPAISNDKGDRFWRRS